MTFDIQQMKVKLKKINKVKSEGNENIEMELGISNMKNKTILSEVQQM